MAIKGSLAEAALPNVIHLLTYSLKSGCLSVTDGRNFGNIFIKDGKIIYATILNRKQRLGHLLISKGIVTNEILAKALDIQKTERKKRLGEILIEMGTITEQILGNELKEQIQLTIFTMLTWDKGYFNFEAGLLPSPEEYTVQLSPQEVLLEAARRIDEWRKIENKMPPFETVLNLKSNVQKTPLTMQEKKIIDLINGKHSVDDIIRLSEFDFFETCRAIYGLLSAGLLEKPERPLKKPTGDIAESQNLALGFYKTEMYDEAEREYQKILSADRNSPEAFLYLGLIELRRGNYQVARENFLTALKAGARLSVLINLGYVCNRLKLYDEAINYLNQAKGIAPEDPKVKCNLGVIYYEQGNLEEAGKLFQQVLESSPDFMTPYIYLSIIYFKKGDSQGVMNILSTASVKFTRSAAFKNNLAVIYESIDILEEAEKLYRQAIDLDSKNMRLYKNLADFYYDAQIIGAAKELYDIIPDDQKDWHVLFNLGKICLRQGDATQALQYWTKARSLDQVEKIVIEHIQVLQGLLQITSD